MSKCVFSGERVCRIGASRVLNGFGCCNTTWTVIKKLDQLACMWDGDGGAGVGLCQGATSQKISRICSSWGACFALSKTSTLRVAKRCTRTGDSGQKATERKHQAEPRKRQERGWGGAGTTFTGTHTAQKATPGIQGEAKK